MEKEKVDRIIRVHEDITVSDTIGLTKEEMGTLEKVSKWLKGNITSLEFDSVTIGFFLEYQLLSRRKKQIRQA